MADWNLNRNLPGAFMVVVIVTAAAAGWFVVSFAKETEREIEASVSGRVLVSTGALATERMTRR